MTLYLKQSTARNIGVGQLLSTTDGLTAYTTAVDTLDIHLWKGNLDTLTHSEVDTAHISNGIHTLALGTTDTDTVGSMIIFIQPTGCLPLRIECCVLAANVYDSLIGGGGVDLLDVSTVQWTGTAVHATGTAGVPIVDLHEPASVTIGTVTTVTGGATSAELAKVPKSDSTVTWNATALASIQTECNDALVANNLDHLLKTAVAEDMTPECADGTIFGRLIGGPDTSAFISTDCIADVHAAIVALAADVGDAGVGSSVVSLVGTLGTELAKVPKSDSNVTWNSTALASINAEVDGALNTAIPGSPTSDSINERIKTLDADWNDGGRLDLLLDGAASAGDPWSTALPGAYGAGTAGLLIGTTIPNAIDAIDNYVDTEIGTLTTELAKVPKSDSNVTWNSTALASINAEVDTALNTAIPASNTTDSVNDVLLDQVKAKLPTNYIMGSTVLTAKDGTIDDILTDTGTTLDALLKRVLGLTQENFRISSPIYSVTGKMTSCTMKIYPTATDCTNDTNVLATYTATATYDVDDNMATYKVVKA